MPVAMAIHGFDYIGRLVTRAALANPEVQVEAVNDPFMDLKYMDYQMEPAVVVGLAYLALAFQVRPRAGRRRSGE